jgi:hypothetical protein
MDPEQDVLATTHSLADTLWLPRQQTNQLSHWLMRSLRFA